MRKKNGREDIAYLLGECDEEEAFEWKRCAVKPDMAGRKIALARCLD